jgi:hypothetical protein
VEHALGDRTQCCRLPAAGVVTDRGHPPRCGGGESDPQSGLRQVLRT